MRERDDEEETLREVNGKVPRQGNGIETSKNPFVKASSLFPGDKENRSKGKRIFLPRV
jgi:hypothetical protein